MQQQSAAAVPSGARTADDPFSVQRSIFSARFRSFSQGNRSARVHPTGRQLNKAGQHFHRHPHRCDFTPFNADFACVFEITMRHFSSGQFQFVSQIPDQLKY